MLVHSVHLLPASSVLRSPQLTAFFTRAQIFASSAAVSSFSAKAVAHMWPSSRFALSLKPNVAYLVLNFCALWKKPTTSPSLAYAGIPYQVFGERAGALALMMAWSRSAMARSGSGMSAIFASRSLSPSPLCAGLAPGRLQLLDAFLHRGSFLVRESLGHLASGSLSGRLRALLCRFPLSHCEAPPCAER